MRKLRTIATLAPIGVGVAALTQAHYLISHFGTIALIAGAVTGGAALLVSKAKGKGRDDEPQEQTYTAEDVISAWQPPAFHELPQARPDASYVDPAAVQQRLRDLAG